MYNIKWRIYDTYTMVIRNMKHMVRQVEVLIMTAILPFMQLFLLVGVFGGSMHIETFSYLDYVLPGILLMGISSSASMSAIAIKEDMSKGIIDRFRTMDIGKSAVLNGHMSAALVRTCITAFILILTAMFMGFRTSMGLSSYLLCFLVIFLFTLMYTWLSIAWGLWCPSLEAVGSLSYLGMLLPYISSCFVPIKNMPSFLQSIAKYQPFTPLSESLRGLFLGYDTGNQIWIAMAWCIGLLLVFYTCAIHLYKRKDHA